ncbi:MAG: NINE protein [Acutalibacteraceae bacterium]|jgi:TM2 domain-containing membrane protein YozV
MYCRNCGQPVNYNQAVCLNCGVKTGYGNNYCQNCGSATDPNAHFCVKCGVALSKTGSNYLNGQDKVLMAVVCFFLGNIGIHNFILGETKKGIVKIALFFCFGISTILALIDFVKILADTYEVNPDKAF